MSDLQRKVERLERANREQQEQIDALRRRLESLDAGAPAGAAEPQSDASALDRAIGETQGDATAPAAVATPAPVLWSQPVGGANVRLIDIALDVLAAAGTSTEDDAEIRRLEGGAHDPRRRGFTLQQAELSLMGAVDPYLSGEAHIIANTEDVELEEAFFTTQALPYGLQVKVGYFLTEFGRMNPTHPHAWNWIDQAVVVSRLFGSEGLRAAGARVGWLMPLPWFSEVDLGLQNANEGNTTVSFLDGEGIGGRPGPYDGVHDLGDMLYLARWNNSWDLTDELTTLAGFSGLFGPNSTGADGQTFVYGTHLVMKWRPLNNFRGWPFVLWESEAMKRDYEADAYRANPPDADLPSATLRDWGLYSQVLYGFRPGWAGGVRYEYASGHGPSVGGRENDPFRDDRYRVAPLLVWHPSEFSRFRLQYNYDQAGHLEGGAHSVWLGAEILYGAHPAHAY